MGKKPPPPPLFKLKQDFKDSLDAASFAGINLIQVCEQVIDLNLIQNEGVAKILRERTAAFRDSLTRDE